MRREIDETIKLMKCILISLSQSLLNKAYINILKMFILSLI